MPASQARLPQLDGGLFLTDGGIETDLIFNDRIELPHFAAFVLLKTQEGTQSLRNYFLRYLQIAKANDVGFILESPRGGQAPTGVRSWTIPSPGWPMPMPKPSA